MCDGQGHAGRRPHLLSQLLLGRPALESLRFDAWLATADAFSLAAGVMRAAAARCCQLRNLNRTGDCSEMVAPLGEMSSLTRLDLCVTDDVADPAGGPAFLQAAAPVLRRLPSLQHLGLCMPPGRHAGVCCRA